jgi:pyruvate dehydrogenase E1 component
VSTSFESNPLGNAHIPSQYVDQDPNETKEWKDSLESAAKLQGNRRAKFLMLELLRKSAELGLEVPTIASTDYINTISPDQEPWFPGDEHIERRIRAFIRWNAAIMVHRAQKYGVGGHISTYASSASLYEVGFNHFFKGHDAPGGADQIFFQGHASPGMYARAFLEGRLSETQLDGFRQELSHSGGGLPSYPHPRLMPNFWQFPTVSMGLGPLNAVYQARFNRYLHARGIKDTSQQRVWAFLGDGEMDEPESISGILLAAREKLDNLTFVVNANLQRLDGPVRGNGKIIQELESLFRGAGWNVIKVIWGRTWDPLLAKDSDGALVNLMNNTPDGDFQTYKAESGAYIREHFFGRDPRTKALVEPMTDDEIWALQRGGHDYRKLYAAYKAASEHKGQPTLIIAKTIKGWTLGSHFEGRNATHQMKKLTLDDLKKFRDTLFLEIPDSKLDEKNPPYYHPGPKDPVIEYMHERRKQLGGYLPERRTNNKPLVLPQDDAYADAKKSSGKQPVATTMAFVRLIKDLMKDKNIGPRFVPVIPDEARTFGLDSIFPTAKIYSPFGQRYTSVDRELFLSYKESEKGQILHEGINEAGSVSSWTAVGTSYATHSESMIPIYIFYSMFGFQRTGDQFWLAMDQMVRGFVIGATAGRTTLTGEGLQHDDGQSMVLASTNPGVVAYDPAFSFEIAHIVKDGLKRMYGENPENIYYYMTVYNEPYIQPEEPKNINTEHLLKGAYLYSESIIKSKYSTIAILASGVAMPWALKAKEILEKEYEVSADVYSVTSWNELRRDGLEVERKNLLENENKKPFISHLLKDHKGPVVAVSDWMRIVPEQIRPYLKQNFVSLGTDGWGVSDTRGALRRHYLVDAESIVVQSLKTLAQNDEIKSSKVSEAIKKYQLNDPASADPGSTAGDS